MTPESLQSIIRSPNGGASDRQDMFHVKRRQMHTKFWYKNLKEGAHLEDLNVDAP